MDFAKLSQNEKLAVYGSVALLVGGAIGYSYGLTALGMLAAIAMLAVIFLPQFSSGISLPGSRGSLMLVIGGLAGVVMVLAFLQAVAGVLFVNTNVRDIFFLIAVAGGLLMAYAGWREFQAEGGKFRFGSSAPAATSPAATPPAPAAAPAAAPASVPAAAEPTPVERTAPPAQAPAVESATVDEPEEENDRPVV